MNSQTPTKEISAKKQLFKTIYNKLDSALAEYRDFIDQKKISSRLKEASKEIAGRIEKEMKRAKKRQQKLTKKIEKTSKKNLNGIKAGVKEFS